MASVEIRQISKSFGNVAAVRELSLQIADGEFFSLLGPSGCGKTTLLRMIAGFEQPDQGQVYFDKAEVTHRKPNQRNTGMVFQNYALFPHLTVFENVAFGLKARQTPREEIVEAVRQALDLVGMAELHNRAVTQLSGGQQQRVALARALAIKPAILLLDEPLSNLDAKLRKGTRAELKRLQRELGITTIYVTHDQEEALALSDRIAVIESGKLQQVASPQQIYNTPSSAFVMHFIGESNLLSGEIVERHGERITINGGSWRLNTGSNIMTQTNVGGKVKIGFRPEHVTLHTNDRTAVAQTTSLVLPAIARVLEFAGTHWLLYAGVDDDTCVVRLGAEQALSLVNSSPNDLRHQQLTLSVPIAQVFVFAAHEN